MRHYPTDNGGHYAVSPEASGRGVLVQVQESHPNMAIQARELLTTDEARAMAGALLDCAMSVENKRKRVRCTCSPGVDIEGREQHMYYCPSTSTHPADKGT